MKRFVLLSLVITSGAAAALIQDRFARVQIKTSHVSGAVYMLEGSGGNIGVSAGDDGLLMIDDQYAPLSDKINSALKALNKGELKYVINTHFHGDHTGGNPFFGRSAPIVAHENVLIRLAAPQSTRGTTAPAMAKEGLPVITFDQSMNLSFNGEPVHIVHFPAGHTDGDSIIFFPVSEVVHMGDHFFVERFPFIDLGNGGTVQGYLENTKVLLDTLPENVKIIPGHGPLATVEDLKKFHTMLVETTAAVRIQMREDKSLDAIKAVGVHQQYKSWGAGFINEETWIETIYRSYSN